MREDTAKRPARINGSHQRVADARQGIRGRAKLSRQFAECPFASFLAASKPEAEAS